MKFLKQRFASYCTVSVFLFLWNGLQILMWRYCLLMAKCICVIMILESWCPIPQSKIMENNYWEKAGCPSHSFKDCSVSLGICFRQLELGTGVFLLLLKFGCSNNLNKNNNLLFWCWSDNFQNKMDVLTFAIESCRTMCFQKLCTRYLHKSWKSTVRSGATCCFQLSSEHLLEGTHICTRSFPAHGPF